MGSKDSNFCKFLILGGGGGGGGLMLNYLLAFGQKYLDLRKLTKAEKFSIKGT